MSGLLVADLLLEMMTINVCDFMSKHTRQLRFTLHVGERAAGNEDISTRQGKGADDLAVKNSEVVLDAVAGTGTSHRVADQVHVFHHVGIVSDPFSHPVQHIFVNPPGHSSLLPTGALGFEGTPPTSGSHIITSEPTALIQHRAKL